MPVEQVLFDRKNGLATITINRQQVINALTAETMAMMLTAFKEAQDDQDVRVILLQGAGGNFSAGADMTLLGASADPVESYRFMKETAGGLILAVTKSPRPVVCKVRGNAYGYAIGLALACDFVIASEEAKFCEAFVNLGIALDGGSSWFLPRLTGMAKARELALLGDAISGRQAETIGLIYKAVPDCDLDGQTEQLTNRLLSKSAGAMHSIRKALEENQGVGLEAALDLEASLQSKLLAGEELQAAVKLFLESRGHKAL